MKIAVVGANGRSGRIFIDYAIARGHKVNAGVHNRNTLLENADLRVIKCDATNKEQLKHLLKDQDAVVSFIGHVKKSPDFVQTEAMKALVEVMKELKIKRLVSITGTGVRQKGDKIPLIDRILNFGLSVFDPTRLKDGIEHAKVLKDSGLDWTILRVLKMQNVKPKPFTLKENGPTKLYVSREEVARAALEVLEDNSFIHKYPILSNKRGV